MKNTLKSWLSIPPYISLEEIRYYSLIRIALASAVGIHLGLLLLFLVLGVQEMFYFELLSIAVFTFALYFNRKRKYYVAGIMGITQVVIHEIVAIKFISADSGFQYYILVAAMLVFLFPKGKGWVKSLTLLWCILGFLASEFIIAELKPIYELGASVNFWLRLINITVVIIQLGVFGLYFSNAMANTEDKLLEEQEKSDKLLKNMLPENIAKELKATGKVIPRKYESITVMFTDFKGFTELVSSIPAISLVAELNDIFGRFDDITVEEGVEKIETTGDGYLAACGVPKEEDDHAYKCVKAAKRMINFLEERNAHNKIQWNMRVGIHSGPIVTGVVGKRKFAYCLFGDTINTASRFETAGEPGKINISSVTYEKIKSRYECEYRGKIYAKGKGELDMYFVK